MKPNPIRPARAATALAVLLLTTSSLPLTAREYPVDPLPETRTIAEGPFEATWASLVDQYRCPEWFRDAKLGIWAHWSAQCVPEEGDWYARSMYIQGHDQYEAHLKKYDHPSEFGFMEIDNLWKAGKWDPEALMDLFVAAGAKFFVSLANHEDNFDCYDSRYHAWNSVNVGPKRDIVGTWARIARERGLRFGVSNHSSHAWHWFQTAYGYDAEGPMAGVRYDAYTLTKADGKGKWWEGLDPQDLYGKPSIVIPDGFTSTKLAHRWHDTNNLPWTELAPPHDPEFAAKWFFRLQDLIDSYQPDFVYLDNGELPFGQVGLDIVAHYYNQNMAANGGKLDGVLTAKGLSGAHRPAVTQAWERSAAGYIQELPFEAETCIGQWHYKKGIEYKTTGHVLRILVDIVSKNGTLLLSIPQRGDGSIDDEELAILEGMADWIAVNGEGIYGTRPWRVFGEGPTEMPRGRAADAPIPYTQEDIRYTSKDGAVYLFVLAVPEEAVTAEELGLDHEGVGEIASVRLLGSGEKTEWSQGGTSLRIEKPLQIPCENVLAYRIDFK